MGTGYTRQSAANIVTGLVVEAAPLNAEFNALVDVFNSSTGHSHDGTTGEGPKIALNTSLSGVLPVAHGGINAIHKIDGTTAPTADDDSADGYGPGSLWIDTTNDVAYICLDATVATAVWQRYQPYDTDLAAMAALATTDGNFIVGNGSAWVVESGATARTSLGLGSLAILSTINDSNWSGTDLAITNGGTGASTVVGARTNLNFTKGSDITSASSLTLGSDGDYFDVTGTTAITSIASVGVGTRILLQFDAALTLTHHATDLILPNSENITTAAGDHAEFIEYATGDWRLVSYQRANGIPLGSGILAGFRNKIINGNFDIWQRGTSGFSTGYTADRWRLLPGSGATCSISRQAFSLGQTDVPGNPSYYARFARSVAGADFTAFDQLIEGVRTLAGYKCTVTFYARASVATTLDVLLLQYFGSGGSPSASVLTPTSVVALTTSWSPVRLTFDLANISGKVLGSNNTDALALRFIRNHDDTNPTANIDIARVSLVEGDATAEADPFSPRHIVQELELCKRYYQTGDISTGGGIGRKFTTSTVGSHFNSTHDFSPEMRKSPTIVLGTPTYENCASIVAGITGSYGFMTSVTPSGSTYYRAYSATWTADAEI